MLTDAEETSSSGSSSGTGKSAARSTRCSERATDVPPDQRRGVQRPRSASTPFYNPSARQAWGTAAGLARRRRPPVANHPPPPRTPRSRSGIGARAATPWPTASSPTTSPTSSPRPRPRPPAAAATGPRGSGACSLSRTPASPTASFAPRAASRTRHGAPLLDRSLRFPAARPPPARLIALFRFSLPGCRWWRRRG
jgi:hypothetical protein